MNRSVVLLSAGLDSTFNLFQSARLDNVVLAITFDYGQKSALRERERARQLCEALEISHKVIDLQWFREFTTTALVGPRSVPMGRDVSIDDASQSSETMKAVWVPNRNGIFINIAAGFAEGLGANLVIPGFNIEEASTFPDNSQDFLNALDQAFVFSTLGKVRVHCYSTALSKTEIVREAMKLQVPLKQLWPCYNNGERWCGQCESCQRFHRGVKMAGAEDQVKGCFA